MTRQERKNKSIAAVTTLIVNAVLLIIMIFAGGWGMSGSGEGDYPGIEVNLGYDEQGGGDLEPFTPIGDEQATDDEDPPIDPQADPQQETHQEAAPIAAEPESTQPSETFTDPTSDVSIHEETKPAENQPAEKTKETYEVKKPEEKKPDPNPLAVYKGKSTAGTTSGDGEGKHGTEGNQGDDNGTGNKGVPGGTEGSAVYKGNPGGGDGGSLVINGWDWDHIPNPKIPDDVPGRIVFEIEVDEHGELIGYKKESGTLSAAAERACVEAIQKLTFTKKSGAKVPPISKGKITFVVRAQ